MFAASKTDSVSGAAPDGQFNYVTMLLHGDGTNGAQNNTFLDSSTNNFTITRNGNTTQGSFSPYGSNWGNYFNGSSKFVLATNAAFGFGTGDFTIELWVFCSFNGAVQEFIDGRSSDQDIPWVLGINGTGLARTYDGTTLRAAGQLTANAWNHVAWSRASNVNNVYVNGTSAQTWTTSQDFGSTQPLTIGNNIGPTSEPYTGYMSNIRIVKGTALYTGSTLTVPTTPLTAVSGTSLLTCQSNRFKDNSSNNFTFTVSGSPSVQRFNPFGTSTAYSTSVIGGSGYFDGTGDTLTCTGTLPSTGDFTLSLWTYPVSLSGYTIAIQQSGSGNFFYLYLGYADGMIDIQVGNSAYTDFTAGVYKANQWNYVQIVKSSSAYSVYVNGTTLSNIGGTGNIGTTSIATGTLTVNYNVGCHITDVRIVTSALSNSVPTAPLTAVSGTTMLLNMNNAGILDNAMMNDLETAGNAQISTSVKKYGTGSLAFDGTGDYLTAPSNPAYNLGSGDFTIEFWVYPNTISIPNPDNESWLVARTNYSANTGWSVFQANQQIRFRVGNTGGTIATGNVITATTWQHIAVVRSGSTVSIYVNGTSQASGTNASFTDASTVLVVGGITSTTGWNGDKPLNGYIDDLRITKGYARYTANFTPPTTAFSDTGPY
jgi:hypothetical protein